METQTFPTNRQPTGSSANDLRFKKMIVEVVYIDGFKPRQLQKTTLKKIL
jgi:hypothetical protein